MSASRGGLPDDSFRVSGRREGLLCATMELNKDHIVIEARDASPLADLVRAQAFSQSDDLRAQSFAVELILETDHLITLQAGAKAREPLFVMFADVRKLIQPHSRGGRAQVGGPAIPLPRLGQVGIEFDDAETL